RNALHVAVEAHVVDATTAAQDLGDPPVARVEPVQRGATADRSSEQDLIAGAPFHRRRLVLPVAEEVARSAALAIDDVDPARRGPLRARHERDATAVRRPRDLHLVAP